MHVHLFAGLARIPEHLMLQAHCGVPALAVGCELCSAVHARLEVAPCMPCGVDQGGAVLCCPRTHLNMGASP
jgi:hypothetical protein